MGVYYTTVLAKNLDLKETKVFSAADANVKYYNASWIDNGLCDYVEALLINNPHHVCWFGDSYYDYENDKVLGSIDELQKKYYEGLNDAIVDLIYNINDYEITIGNEKVLRNTKIEEIDILVTEDFAKYDLYYDYANIIDNPEVINENKDDEYKDPLDIVFKYNFKNDYQKYRYLINHSKKEYLDFIDYFKNAKDPLEHPLARLTCNLGNVYFKSLTYDYKGYWAFDKIEISESVSDDYTQIYLDKKNKFLEGINDQDSMEREKSYKYLLEVIYKYSYRIHDLYDELNFKSIKRLNKYLCVNCIILGDIFFARKHKSKTKIDYTEAVDYILQESEKELISFYLDLFISDNQEIDKKVEFDYQSFNQIVDKLVVMLNDKSMMVNNDSNDSEEDDDILESIPKLIYNAIADLKDLYMDD